MMGPAELSDSEANLAKPFESAPLKPLVGAAGVGLVVIKNPAGFFGTRYRAQVPKDRCGMQDFAFDSS